MIKAKDKEKYLAAIRRFKLFDDTFMSVVFDNHIEATQCILRIILNNSALSVVSVKTQDVLTNLHGKSIRLDITAIDSNGIIYNIEIQKDEAGAKTKRARYNSSMLDASSLQPGEDWEMLPESYVIIFTETDFFKKKHPIYHIERVIIEDDKSLFDD